MLDVYAVELLTWFVKLDSLNHPPNVYPVFVGVGKLIVPPLQLAVNVWFDAVVTVESAFTNVLPLYHPPKFHVTV